MKKIMLCAFLFIGIVVKSNAQQEKDTLLNLILLIDDKVQLSINQIEISYVENGVKNKFTDLKYEAGNLSMNIQDYDKLFLKGISDIQLLVSYHPYKTNEPQIYNYEIDVNPRIIKSRILVFYIYNLDNKKKRRKYRFESLSDDKKYTYEIDCGDLFIGRLKK